MLDETNAHAAAARAAQHHQGALLHGPRGQARLGLHGDAERFKESLKDQERLGMLFVTAHGKPNERLLGIITAWDLAKFL